MQRQQEEKNLQIRLQSKELELYLLQRQEDFDKCIEAMTQMAEDNRAHRLKPPKLKSIKGGDRVNVVLTRFETHMTTFAVPKPEWPAHLRFHTGKGCINCIPGFVR